MQNSRSQQRLATTGRQVAGDFIPLPADGFAPAVRMSIQIELPANCVEFYNDDEGYRIWRRANPDGWVMNNYRVHDGPVPAHKQDMETALTILHVTEKAHVLNRSSTTRYRKLCCAERKPLEEFKRTIIARTSERSRLSTTANPQTVANDESGNLTVPEDTVSGINKKDWKIIGKAGRAVLAFTVTLASGVILALFRMVATGSKRTE